MTPFDRGVTPSWVVHPTTSPGVSDELSAIGWVCAEEIYGMTGDIDDLRAAPAVPDGIDLIEAAPDDSALWMEMVSWRYEVWAEPDTLHG